jgi:hypothetical protein
MASAALKSLYEKGRHLSLGVDKYKEKEIALEKYALALAYNAFSKEKINIAAFNSKRTQLSSDEIPLAEEKATAMIQAIKDEESKEKAKVVSSDRLDPNITKEANSIYSSGKFLEYLLQTFNEYWYGDGHILAWVAIQYVNSWLANPNIGIHLHITGPSSTGKSDSVKAAMKLLPDDHRVIGSFTRRGIVYKMATLEPGTTILHDDHVADEDEMELNRAILAAWEEGYDYNSVEEGETHTIRLPPRINRIITNTSSISKELSQGQDDSRFVTIELNRDTDSARQICEFIQKPHPVPEHRIAVCRAIFDLIAHRKPLVEIPEIKADDIMDPLQLRRFKQELTTRKAITVMNGRTVATEDDIRQAKEFLIYTRKMLSTEVPGLSRNERVVYQLIYDYFMSDNGNQKPEMAVDSLKERCVLPSSSFYNSLRGEGGTFESPTGGLLAAIPGMYVVDGNYDEVKKKTMKVLIFAYGNIRPM